MKLTFEQLKKDPSLAIDFVDFFFGFKLFSYQKNFLKICLHDTRVAGKWCRQSGKSQIVSIYVLLRAMLEKTSIILVSPTQNQSNELFKKVQELVDTNPDIKVLVKQETKQEINFYNGSRIISLPVGFEGRTIRGYTADLLVIEESGIVEDVVVNTVLVPMLASKGDRGQIIKIGTPLTRNHFYRSCYEDNDYMVVNVIWQDCVKEGQYTQKFINEQKAQLTDIEFRTEYSSEFIDDAMSFFPMAILNLCKKEYSLIQYI